MPCIQTSKRQEPGNNPGNVYIFRSRKGGYCKIGRTGGAIDYRLKAVTKPNEYDVFHSIKCSDMVSVERYLHTKFHRVRGLQGGSAAEPTKAPRLPQSIAQKKEPTK